MLLKSGWFSYIDQIFSRFNALERSFFSAVLAFVGYGSWAYFVNSMHGWAASLKAALVQGSYSFFVTLVMTLFMEHTYRVFLRFLRNGLIASSFAVLFTCGLLFSGSWWINSLAGTPEIFDTVILGYIIGGLYTISYINRLNAHAQSVLA